MDKNTTTYPAISVLALAAVAQALLAAREAAIAYVRGEASLERAKEQIDACYEAVWTAEALSRSMHDSGVQAMLRDRASLVDISYGVGRWELTQRHPHAWSLSAWQDEARKLIGVGL